MACRRNDRARFIGCHVGSVVIRGCERGCCPYGYEKADIERNERDDYLRRAKTWKEEDYKIITYTNVSRPPRMTPAGLYICLNSYRPKYVCTACRRVFKPAVLDRNEYEIWNGRGWWVNPKRSEIPEVWKRWIELNERRKDPESREEVRRLYEMEDRLRQNFIDGKLISKEELESIRTLENPNPGLWREPLRTACPSCSAEGTPVGGTFRAPKQADAKGWKRVEELLQNGERFTYCLTREKEMDVLRAAAAENQRRAGAEAWAVEKSRRIRELTGKNVA